MKVEVKLTGPDGDVQRQRGRGRVEVGSTRSTTKPRRQGERLKMLQRKFTPVEIEKVPERILRQKEIALSRTEEMEVSSGQAVET